MKVRRVHEGRRSWIIPPLEESWSHFEKLQWLEAAVECDAGLHAVVVMDPHRVQSRFTVLTGRKSYGPFDYRGAWTFLNGLQAGAEAVADRAAANA